MSKKNIDRRQFLISILKTSGQLAAANSIIYSASLISKNGKFGSLAAGAKTWTWESSWGRLSCPVPSPMGSFPTKSACDANRDAWMRSQPPGGVHCSTSCDGF